MRWLEEVLSFTGYSFPLADLERTHDAGKSAYGER